MDWNVERYNKTCSGVTERGIELIEYIKKSECNKVLDLGCGTGVLTNEISKFTNDVIGIDSSPAMVEKAKTSYPYLKFYLMDACSLEWNNYFDTVFSNAVFHFIMSQNILLNSINKSLKLNGILITEFGAFGNIIDLINAIAQVCERRGKKFKLRFYYPKLEEYEQLLKKNGFSTKTINIQKLDTKLPNGESGIRNWINQVFQVELDWFTLSEREEVLIEIENSLRANYWDGINWHLTNYRLFVMARKTNEIEES